LPGGASTYSISYIGSYNNDSFGGVTGEGEGTMAEVFLASLFCWANLICTVLVAYIAW